MVPCSPTSKTIRQPSSSKTTLKPASKSSISRRSLRCLGIGALTSDSSSTNARTALDHLIFALAIQGGGDPQAGKTAFPIFDDRDKYFQVRGRGTRKVTVRDEYLAGVEERWRKKIDDVQPYRHGKRARTDPLWTLSDIANGHKHQTLKAARITIQTPTVSCFTVTGAMSNMIVRLDPRRPNPFVSVEAKIGTSGKTLSYPAIVVVPHVHMAPKIRPGVIFGDDESCYTLFQVRRALKWSRAIIKWFEPAFDPGV